MNWTKKPPVFITYALAGSQAAKSLLTKRKMFLENSELAPKLQQKKSPSNSEIVDFDHKPFLTMDKALLCQDESSLILTTTGQEKCFGKRFQREMCTVGFLCSTAR